MTQTEKIAKLSCLSRAGGDPGKSINFRSGERNAKGLRAQRPWIALFMEKTVAWNFATPRTFALKLPFPDSKRERQA
ncbi:MAG: hypothetical protein ACRCYZ_04340 [Alphaproteobacteria bacterium]